jgi:hypothetical protein
MITNCQDNGSIIDSRTRVLLMAVRQALIIALRAIEEYLGVDQSIPRRNR